MKRLRSGVVNTLSFIKVGNYVVNDFTVRLEKIVGTDTLELTGLTDSKNLDDCSDFVVINVDLITNELDGGEYILHLTNGNSTQKYLANVEVSKYINTTNSGLYSSTVVLTKNADDWSTASLEDQILNETESMILVYATSLSEAQTKISALTDPTIRVLGSLDDEYNLTDMLDGTLKVYALTTMGGEYVYHSRIDPGTATSSNVPFANAFPDPYYKTINIPKDQVTELISYSTDEMFPVFTGLGGTGLNAIINFSVSKSGFFDPDSFFNLNPNIQFDNGYGASPSFTQNGNGNKNIKVLVGTVVDDLV